MPITGPASYLPAIDDFLAHWASANAALGAGKALVIADGVKREDLAALRTALSDQRDAVTDRSVERSLARESLTALLTALQARLVEFNERIRADLPSSPFARVLPAAFSVGDAEGSVREPLRQVRKLWEKVNALTPVPPGLELPFTLREGYTLDILGADIEALRVAYLALSDADQELRLARERRNDLQDKIQPILKNYRAKVPTAFPDGDAIVETLPALSPAPGKPTVAVKAQAHWDPAQSAAKLTWDASKDTDLKHYEVRAVAGDSYNSDDEAVLATVPPEAPREFASAFALSQPGLTVGYKVYVVLKSGNEKGSEPAYVTRPA